MAEQLPIEDGPGDPEGHQDPEETRGPAPGDRRSGNGHAVEGTGDLRLRSALDPSVEELPDAVRAEIQQAVQSLRTDLDAVHVLPQQVGRALAIVRDAVSDIAAAEETVGDRMAAMGEEMAAIREGVLRSVEEVAGRLDRVDRLAGVIESLGKKRGFKDLIATERRAMEQQEEMTRLLEKLAQRVAEREEMVADRLDATIERLDRLSERLEVDPTGFAAVIDDLRESLRTDLASAVEAHEPAPLLDEDTAVQISERLSAQVAAALEEVSRASRAGASGKAIKDLAGRQRESEKATKAVRTELERVRKRLDSWGRARSAPRIASEVTGLEERVIELEKSIQEDLADQVFERMQHLFDRRFDALVQLIDTRTQVFAARGGDDRRGGLFRR